MRTWRCFAHMGRGHRAGIHPSRPPEIYRWSRKHLTSSGFPSYSSSTSQLLSAMPTESRWALGKPDFAGPHPHSAFIPVTTAQPQTGSAEILP